MSATVKELRLDEYEIDGAIISLRERNQIIYTAGSSIVHLITETLVKTGEGGKRQFGDAVRLSQKLRWDDGTPIEPSDIESIRAHLAAVNLFRKGWLEIE